VGVLPQRKVPYTANLIHILHAPKGGLFIPFSELRNTHGVRKVPYGSSRGKDTLVEPHCRAVRVFPLLAPPLQTTPADSHCYRSHVLLGPPMRIAMVVTTLEDLNLRLASQIGVTDIASDL